MRFESLLAYAFGPLKNRRLEFAAGMNVVHGPNESGKSSWHAALFAGLCGMRRGKGQRSEDAEFANRHRPWDGSAWKVALTLALQDGRRVELLQDLDARTAAVTDADLGRDYAGEILYDGAPDGSVWLGLNREVYPAIACVRQAQILEVLKDPQALQQHLQRAADTRGAEGTAARAIEAIREFRSQQIGIDRANARRPLRLAREACDEARERLSRAMEEHRGYEELLQELSHQNVRLAQASRKRRHIEALRARLEARQAAQLLREVEELSDRFPDGAPAGLAAQEGLMQEAVAVLEAYRTRLTPIAFPEPAVEDIEKELVELPAPGPGDWAPVPALVEACKAFLIHRGMLEAHQRQRPLAPAFPDNRHAGIDDLKSLATALEEAAPATDPELERHCAQLGTRIAAAQARKGKIRLALVLLFLPAAGGLLCLWLKLTLPGLLLLTVAAGSLTWILLHRPDAQLLADQQELKPLDALRTRQQFEQEAWGRRQDLARQRAAEIGLPADPRELRAAATRRLEAEAQQRRLQDWQQQLGRLEPAVRQSGGTLRSLLEAQGEIPGEDLEAAYASYQARCRQRVQRRDLEQKLEQAREETRLARETGRRLEEFQSRLSSAALRCGVPAGDAGSLAAGLEEWLRRRTFEQARREEDLRQWQQLQDRLGGRALGELKGEAAKRLQIAEELSAELDPTAAEEEIPSAQILIQEHDAAEAEIQALQTEIVRLQTRLDEREQQLVLPAEAEEALRAAEDELLRINQLDRILGQTLEFLEQAQNQVHRNIAPALTASIMGWLPSVTGGRYVEARVDPQNLMVSVQEAGGVWREAPLLSRGTTEQIYLLLRIALAQYLIHPGELSPLVLDDVTVQSDAGRTRAILETLLALSEERQIILFSQEEAVLEWASERLSEPRHRLMLLDPPT